MGPTTSADVTSGPCSTTRRSGARRSRSRTLGQISRVSKPELSARDDRLVVNGQKVWTSFARHSDYAYALVRTDSDTSKHAGISLVVIDMHCRGVTVRPLRTLIGGWEFAEVFFDDVEVPASEVVGPLHGGWPIAVEALALERGRSFAERSLRLRREVAKLAALCTRIEPLEDGARGKVVDSYLDTRCLASVVRRVLRLIESGRDATALAALAKLHWSEAHQRLLGAGVEALETRVLEPEASEWVRAFLYSRGETIYAGTSEVQRNTLARFIGLPGVRSEGSSSAAARPRLSAGAVAAPEDARMLREGLDDLLAAELTPGRRTSALEGSGFDAELWRALGGAGWLGLGCESDLSALGRTLVELGEAAGACLIPGPLGQTITITAPLLAAAARSGPDVDAVIGGHLLAALVMPDAGTPIAPRLTAVSASHARAGVIVLNGTVRGVQFAAEADRLVVPFEYGGRVGLALVSPDHSGVQIGAPYSVDLAAPRSQVTFDSVEIPPNELLGDPIVDHRDALATALRRYMLWLDGESLGGAERVLSRAVEYVGQRRQFGVPVGSFQAVKHSLANAYAELELARGHAYEAAAEEDNGGPEARVALAASRLICGRMYQAVVERSIQAHGGVGFTWEHGIHLWYRRALAARHDPFPASVLKACVGAAVSVDMSDATPPSRERAVA